MKENNRIITDSDLKEKIISWVVMTLMFITIWYMLNIVLLTFVITFVFYHLVELIQRKRKEHAPYRIPDAFILTVLYSILSCC
jgi:predicted PurR-regulated permease PerM